MKIVNLYNRIYNKRIFKKYGMNVGEGVLIGGRIHVKGEYNKISIGAGTTINSDMNAVPLGYQEQTIFWTMDQGRIEIGKHCGITNATLCSANSIVIEDDVFLGGGVKIFDTDFHSLDYEKRMDIVNDNDRKNAPIVIKKGAFIGAGVTILKGVTIGEKSIVGAASLVTHDIPDGEIWGGNPARFIRKI